MRDIADSHTASDTPHDNFHSVKVTLNGRYMLENRSEHPCTVIAMSSGSAHLRCAASGRIGERVIAYIDHIGRIEGTVLRQMPDGFSLSLTASQRKKDKLAAQLTWLANKHELDLPEDRRHERIMPRNAENFLVLPDGRQYRCRIIDLSLSGAAMEIDVRPALYTVVTLGTMRGTVVRHFEDGIAIEFAHVQQPTTLDQLFR
ncbi:PilZ domain-containing protein [Phyllobacterium salinisoli]|uniref:PilZ domain-containing protein n=1 Tax=Phyllobacterium salinisoli TaxID=1899321 RepID=A0A368JXY1_9HYPH|nr:PilZ domain-containing protein [Phyllobacterium salinisoli]RCS22006.1 PilZ domain-containing protein [Phyllobacterium salinisoli]